MTGGILTLRRLVALVLVVGNLRWHLLEGRSSVHDRQSGACEVGCTLHARSRVEERAGSPVGSCLAC